MGWAAMLVCCACDPPASVPAPAPPVLSPCADGTPFVVTPRTDDACTTGSEVFCLHALRPPAVPSSGGRVFIERHGPQPALASIRVNEAEVAVIAAGELDNTWDVLLPPIDGERRLVPVDLSVVDAETGVELARLDGAGAYVDRPPLPVMHVTAQDAFALAPELTRPCARRATLNVANEGDHPFTVSSARVDGVGFELAATCEGVNIADEPCVLELCFSPPRTTTAGTWTGSVSFVIADEAAECLLTTDVSFDVLEAGRGLDDAFGDGGVALLPPPSLVRAADDLIGVPFRDGLLLHERFGFTLVSAAGELVPVEIPPLNNVISDFASTASGALYVMSAPGRLAKHAGPDLDEEWRVPIAAGGSLHVTSQESALVVGSRTMTTYNAFGESIGGNSIPLRFDAAGVALESVRDTALDGQDTLYVALRDVDAAVRVMRFSTTGAIDSSFEHPPLLGDAVLLAGAQDSLWLALALGDDARLIHLADDGAVLSDTATSPLYVANRIVVDSRGGVLLGTTSDDGVVRFSPEGVLEGRVGLAHDDGPATGALAVPIACPSSGGCFLGGGNALEAYVARVLP